MRFSAQNSPSPWSATSAITWLLRSMAQSLSARQARSAWARGIIFEPGSRAVSAIGSSLRRTRSGTNRNNPPQRVTNRRGARSKVRASAHRLHGGAWQLGALLVEAPGQRGEAQFAQHLAHGGGTQRCALLLERFGDFVHGVIALAQPLDGGARGGFFRLALGAAHGGEEKRRVGVAAEVVAQHAERAFGVAELGGDLLRRALVDEVAAQRLVLALFGVQGLEEEAPAFRYFFRCTDRHTCTMSHTEPSVNAIATRCALALAIYRKTWPKRTMARTDAGRMG